MGVTIKLGVTFNYEQDEGLILPDSRLHFFISLLDCVHASSNLFLLLVT